MSTESARAAPGSDNNSEPKIDKAAEYARLADLSLDEYDRERDAVAEKLDIRVSTLDTMVRRSRKGSGAVQGKTIAVADVEPWPDPVEGAQVLDAITQSLRDHIILTSEQADTVSLWSVYSHAFDVWRISPRLGFRAPGKGCGKTETLRRLKRLAARALSCENLTLAVLFRLIDCARPTMCMDEVDNLLTEDKGAILGVMNSGYERDGKVFRCIGDEYDLRAFSTFAPMAYAMIGTPPGTFDSRTITIEMRRATPTEAGKLLSMEDSEPEDVRFKNLGRKAARWTKDNLYRLAEARPNMAGLVNRPADNWRPLFAIADVVGGTWPERSRKAARALVGASEAQSVFEETIAAIKDIIGQRTEITSKEIVDRLVKIDGGPWAEWGKSRNQITQNALARLLKPYKVWPIDIGPERSRRKGYRQAQFEPLFEAYLKPPSPPPGDNRAAAQNATESAPVGGSQPRSPNSGCADENCEKSSNDGHLRGCADTDGGHGQAGDDLGIPDFLRRSA
jgi:putative DNA primase/helicase